MISVVEIIVNELTSMPSLNFVGNLLSERWLLIVLCLIGPFGCQSPDTSPPKKLSIGVVNLDNASQGPNQFDPLQNYLSQRLNSIIELEPTYNEIQALNQIKRQRWDVIFAPPGIAAIAISESKYEPLMPLEGALKNRSVIAVKQDSPVSALTALSGKKIALGQPGSATGYYFPLFNLYGLTLAKVQLADTPKTVVGWIADGTVDAGALSLDQLNRIRSEFPGQRFRVVHSDSHDVPSGSVLVSPLLEPRQKDQIRQALAETPSAIAASAGYIVDAPVPDYGYMIKVVARVRPIAEKIKTEPAALYD